MKKVILTVAAAAALIGCSTGKKTQSTSMALINPMTNAVDSMSYSLGINMGSSLLENLKTIPGDTVNKDLIVEAFTKVLKADSTLMLDSETAQSYFAQYIEKEQKKAEQEMKEKGEKFLEENKNNPDVKVTDSGLQYMVITEGKGAKPVDTDKVKVHYTGTTIEGKVFDSSVQRGEPAIFGVTQVIQGWVEALQLMPVGSKWKLFIPYNLAYGERGVPQAGIKPYAPLVFEVELLDIVK